MLTHANCPQVNTSKNMGWMLQSYKLRIFFRRASRSGREVIFTSNSFIDTAYLSSYSMKYFYCEKLYPTFIFVSPRKTCQYMASIKPWNICKMAWRKTQQSFYCPIWTRVEWIRDRRRMLLVKLKEFKHYLTFIPPKIIRKPFQGE